MLEALSHCSYPFSIGVETVVQLSCIPSVNVRESVSTQAVADKYLPCNCTLFDHSAFFSSMSVVLV